MAGLQRSTKSFRRQGSSGLVWDDELLSEEVKQLTRREGNGDNRELRPSYSIGGSGMMGIVELDAAPSFYPRSLSAPATKPPPSPKLVESKSKSKLVGGSGKPPTAKIN